MRVRDAASVCALLDARGRTRGSRPRGAVVDAHVDLGEAVARRSRGARLGLYAHASDAVAAHPPARATLCDPDDGRTAQRIDVRRLDGRRMPFPSERRLRRAMLQAAKCRRDGDRCSNPGASSAKCSTRPRTCASAGRTRSSSSASMRLRSFARVFAARWRRSVGSRSASHWSPLCTCIPSVTVSMSGSRRCRRSATTCAQARSTPTEQELQGRVGHRA